MQEGSEYKRKRKLRKRDEGYISLMKFVGKFAGVLAVCGGSYFLRSSIVEGALNMFPPDTSIPSKALVEFYSNRSGDRVLVTMYDEVHKELTIGGLKINDYLYTRSGEGDRAIGYRPGQDGQIRLYWEFGGKKITHFAISSHAILETDATGSNLLWVNSSPFYDGSSPKKVCLIPVHDGRTPIKPFYNEWVDTIREVISSETPEP